MNAYPKRLIEVDLPIKRISVHARREKSIRHGHISTLHIWWARRPLAACRAVICASLWPAPNPGLDAPPCPPAFITAARTEMLKWTQNQRLKLLDAESQARFQQAQKNPALFDDLAHLQQALFDFIADFANWDNSTKSEYLATSRTLTQVAHEALGGLPGTRPLVVDPFAGGGSIPLEALRVGADAFASDLNPIPVLLNKVVLEYIPKYGQQLADEVRKWGQWIKEQAEKELAELYPKDLDAATPIAYLWARTILSEEPTPEELPVEIPLIRSMWLAKKRGRKFAFRWARANDGKVQTEVVTVTYKNETSRKVRRPILEIFKPKSDFEVGEGTTQGGAAICPVTGFVTSVESVRKQLERRNGGSSDARLLAVVVTHSDIPGRIYRQPTPSDWISVELAKNKLELMVREHNSKFSLIPDGKLNHLRGFFNVVLYGMTTWGDLFDPRQTVSLLILQKLIRQLQGHQLPPSLMEAIMTCLALILDRCADKCASVVVWNNVGEKVEHVFGRQALPMVWDYSEANILADIGWSGACDWVIKVIEHNVKSQLNNGTVNQSSATNNPLPSDSVDAVITDPPYYAAIPYADLSDFFYSWLRRSLYDIHPDLFRTELTPKDEECVSLAHRAAMYRNKNNSWFEEKMTLACQESCRITKPSGVSIFVFANKETSGWEAMLAALISAGWVVTASWPIDTEMATRLRARNSATLASSVHLVCRPRETKNGNFSSTIGDWRDTLQELPIRIHEWLPRLAAEGVVGADAIFACLGPALEIFSRYSRVEKANGDQVCLGEYLEVVWAAVSKEALTMVFAGADTSGFEEDARLTAMWLWTLSTGKEEQDTKSAVSLFIGQDDVEMEDEESSGSKGQGSKSGYALEYDAARKIAQGLGAHLEQLNTLIHVKGSEARLLSVRDRTKYLFGKATVNEPAPRSRKAKQMGLFAEAQAAEAADRDSALNDDFQPGNTTLDRVHQSMLLFQSGRSDVLKRFLVDQGIGQNERFWRLAQAFSALYPTGSDEKRWVDGVLARKKGLGL